jgi:hypothetical protein
MANKKTFVVPSDLSLLPELKGTLKQIKWAESIRLEAVSSDKFNIIPQTLLDIVIDKDFFLKIFSKNRKEISQKNESTYWINWRYIVNGSALRDTITEYADNGGKFKEKEKV